MKCMFCGSSESKVIDSRPVEEANAIRRRRECTCGKRFTTYETIETTPLLVIKSNGTRQAFDVNKVRGGILRACEKRPVAMQDIDRLVGDIERKLYNSLEREVPSQKIGELVMTGLKGIDDVAYIRFASVYRQFKDSSTFLEELTKLLNENKLK